ncbi:hypothetical protein GCM10027291_11170 [Telluribacter humicola]|uniref:DUF4249 domain-containing protein n=1 Tax=Telluribacter humicola TaxID=1720261 RepID=UPI001A95678E|nr:DUF4249 domain-containing protein [Telluribacter humicola]
MKPVLPHIKRFERYLSWGLMILSGCVTPYEAEIHDPPASIVVQGRITNLPGPYSIKIVVPASNAYKGLSFGVEKAKVYITDNEGNHEDLVEQKEPGLYQTTTLQGVTGRVYQLHIEAKGKKYESKPELLRSVNPIERVYDETFRSFEPLTGRERLGGWKVYVDTKDPSESGNYYRWNWIRYKLTDVCATIDVPPGNPAFRFPCCGYCWDILRCLGPDCISLRSDALINGNTINRQLITEVPVECLDRVYLEVEQQSISRDAYVYWKATRQMLQNTGGVFDSAPTAVPGNIVCTTDPDEQVFGLFEVAGITRKGHLVDRTQAEYSNCPPILPLPAGGVVGCAPCEESRYRTAKAPDFWEF